MKRARPESTACDDPPPIAPDALLALLTDADTAVGKSIANACRVSAVTADMCTRNSDAVKQALADLSAARAEIRSCTRRVRFNALRRARMAAKNAAAALETSFVSMKQLRVCAQMVPVNSLCQTVMPDGIVTTSVGSMSYIAKVTSALALLASSIEVAAPVVGVLVDAAQLFAGELGRVSKGDGLHVLTAEGPGLTHYFDSNPRNEFHLLLAAGDGSLAWLSPTDVVISVEPIVGLVHINAVQPIPVLFGRPRALVHCQLVCGGSPDDLTGGCGTEDVGEVVLRLAVCCVTVAPWCARVRRKVLCTHRCAAGGAFVRRFETNAADSLGMAGSADEKWLVVGSSSANTLSVYSLPGCELFRTVGGLGQGPGRFDCLCRLCFAPNGNVIAVDRRNRRLQELTLEGDFDRFIGDDSFDDAYPYCVATHDDLVAVGCSKGTGPRVLLLDFCSGGFRSCFGEVSFPPAHSELSHVCSGIRFTADGHQLVIAEFDAARLSIFTIEGVFVRCLGEGVLRPGISDVLLSASGEFVIADCRSNRVCVLKSDEGGEGVLTPAAGLIRSWGVDGPLQLRLGQAVALSAAGAHLYVLESLTGRLQLFE